MGSILLTARMVFLGGSLEGTRCLDEKAIELASVLAIVFFLGEGSRP